MTYEVTIVINNNRKIIGSKCVTIANDRDYSYSNPVLGLGVRLFSHMAGYVIWASFCMATQLSYMTHRKQHNDSGILHYVIMSTSMSSNHHTC